MRNYIYLKLLNEKKATLKPPLSELEFILYKINQGIRSPLAHTKRDQPLTADNSFFVSHFYSQLFPCKY